jgi:hypothetical protein
LGFLPLFFRIFFSSLDFYLTGVFDRLFLAGLFFWESSTEGAFSGTKA